MQTNEDLMSDLIHKAKSGKHQQFQFIRSWPEYINARKTRRAYKLLVSSIIGSSNKLFKKYCKEVTTGDADVFKLLAYCSTLEILKYYEEELNIISDMIDEYEAYLMTDCNFLGAWLFYDQRPLIDLWDHRS